MWREKRGVGRWSEEGGMLLVNWQLGGAVWGAGGHERASCYYWRLCRGRERDRRAEAKEDVRGRMREQRKRASEQNLGVRYQWVAWTPLAAPPRSESKGRGCCHSGSMQLLLKPSCQKRLMDTIHILKAEQKKYSSGNAQTSIERSQRIGSGVAV